MCVASSVVIDDHQVDMLAYILTCCVYVDLELISDTYGPPGASSNLVRLIWPTGHSNTLIRT